ncbi:phospholipase D-like domain-containing protein [Methylocystis heyeri]|uniref:phospholipase D-like domain-containing protein n=1 Tax=Methylocystis heyeri TaxID=391905 RepID=UPI001136E6F1|nr:phospholipase D-like domain-containing protein [Methylocystis heyeri]
MSRRTCLYYAFTVFAATASAAVFAGEAEIHYAPVENLERIDLALLRSARKSIDIAAYTLTDRPVIEALIDARRRGVAVRLVLDPGQNHALELLRPLSGGVRMKPPGPYMHLKAYAIDRVALRSGSANLSASGLKKQDNDLIVLRDSPKAVAAFEARFDAIWTAADPWTASAGAPAPERGGAACAIKGNVNSRGERIYHLPNGRGYARVTMKGDGKRWFCSEAQAVAAGWRKAAR